MPDAVVIGAGPNGLVAANLLADRGLDVLVFEAQPDAGGAARSAELIEPGYRNDGFSAFHGFPAGPLFFVGSVIVNAGPRGLRSTASG